MHRNGGSTGRDAAHRRHGDGAGVYEPTATNQHGSSCANFDGTDYLGKMALTIKWSSTVYIANTKVTFGTSAGSVSGTTTDALSYGPGTATGSFATADAVASLVSNIPAPGGDCPTSPVFSSFALSGSLSL